MITAVDANVILDVLVGVPSEAEESSEALRLAELQGKLIISAVCFAEVAGNFPTQARAEDFFELIRCSITEIDKEIAYLSGVFYRSYRKRGGERTRILPDFLIAAHAQIKADRLLTRDKRFFGTTFPKLKTVAPRDVIIPRSSK
ncbi:MAG: putative nucleic acid-binding protein contains domain [Acidobacteriaceae bacterium]|nr:putative nucleic acid-binding protein contains domain [Acidobacteriaceae bacterium]